MNIQDIFTPNDIPTITYVGREDLRLEEDLRSAMQLKNMVVSLSGPSKTGKTVLIKKILDEDLVIPVVVGGLKSANEIWDRALSWMDLPKSILKTTSAAQEVNFSASGGGEAGIPFVAKGKVNLQTGGKSGSSDGITQTYDNSGLGAIIREIAKSDYVIFIDDFHYIESSICEEVGRQIKVANDNGVKILTASVPHRSDDVVRSNSELRGRVAGIDIGRWEDRHLMQISKKGFDELNIELAPPVQRRLVQEALGSPQIMQTICLSLCEELRIHEKLPIQKRVEITDDQIANTLLKTSRYTDFSKMLSSLHAGPRTRGTERKLHKLTDGTQGDVYRAVLLAIKQEPVSLTFTYDDIIARIRKTCSDDIPAGSSVTSCLEQMNTISEQLQPSATVLAWDGDNLDIVDPYFAFFLRCSEKLKKLGDVNTA